MKTRINPKTGREEYWNEPPGLPGIWMTRGFCDRCYPFNKCLGLMNLSDKEWKSIEDLIVETNNILNVEEVIKSKDLNICSVA
jgi:hypothetical protein